MKKTLVIGLLLVVVLIAGCYGTQTVTPSTPTTTQPAATNNVEIKGFAYGPETITVTKGTTVTWTNEDSAPHTVTTTNAPVAFDSGKMNQGEQFSQTFDTAGTYEYYCSIHPNMRGKVIVTE